MLQQVFRLQSDDESETEENSETGALYDDDSIDPFGFYSIVGTSAHDESLPTMVLTPPLMGALRQHLPFACRQDFFWIKYSLIRDVSI